MRAPDYLLLAALAVGAFFVLRSLWRWRKNGCCGGCGGCAGCKAKGNCRKRSP